MYGSFQKLGAEAATSHVYWKTNSHLSHRLIDTYISCWQYARLIHTYYLGQDCQSSLSRPNGLRLLVVANFPSVIRVSLEWVTFVFLRSEPHNFVDLYCSLWAIIRNAESPARKPAVFIFTCISSGPGGVDCPLQASDLSPMASWSISSDVTQDTSQPLLCKGIFWM